MKSMKKLLLALLLFFPGVAKANCLGVWEVSTLAQGSHAGYNLDSENGETFISITTAWVRKLDEVSRKIDRTSGVYTTLFICGNRSLNAYATKVSGANAIFINTGFIDKAGSDWDLYAALLGHENAHLAHNHGSQRQIRGIGIDLLNILAQSAVKSMADDGSIGRAIGEEAVNLGGKAIYAYYSRGDESEADRFGLDYAHRAGFDPHGSIRLHRMLGTSSDFLSSHPSSGDRIASLTAQIASLSISQTQVASTTQSKGTKGTNTTSLTSSLSSSTSSSSSGTSVIQDTSAYDLPSDGVVLKVKSRYKYYIAFQSNFTPPAQGATVHVKTGDGEIAGTVERINGNYFSVLTTTSIDESLVGKKVTF